MAPSTRSRGQLDERESPLTRTAAWSLYWCCVLASALLPVGVAGTLEGTGSGRSWLSGTPRFGIRFLAICFPFLWAVVGPPPGYTALHHYRTRLGSTAGDSTGPSAVRTGVELLLAVTIAYSLPATILFAEPIGERGGWFLGRYALGDGSPRTESIAETLGVVSAPTPFFTLAVLGLLLAASSWFVLWITR